MSLERFLSGSELVAGATAHLDGGEAHHLVRVMRKKVGAEITLFDGRGSEARARIVALGRDVVDLEVLEVEVASRAPACRIALEVALPRGGEAQDLVRRAIECGVAWLRPILTDRSVHRAEKKDPEKRRERFDRAALAALKQSGRNLMPEFAEPIGLDAIVLEAGERGFFGATRGGLAPRAIEAAGVPPRVRLVVGPEGGLSEREEELLIAKGFEPLSLGAGILRVETAVVALVSWFASARPEDLRSE